MLSHPSTTRVEQEALSVLAIAEYSRYKASMQPSTISVVQEPLSVLADSEYSI